MPLNIDWQQILVHMFNFTILAGGLYFLLYKLVKSFMDSREADYAKREEEIEGMKKDNAAILEECTTRLKSIEKDISQRRAEAMRSAEKTAEAYIDNAKKESDRIIRHAQEEARRQKEKAVEEAREEIVELAAAMARKAVEEASGNDR